MTLDSSSAAALVAALTANSHSWPFLSAVDPHAHGCPDYLDVIAEPMGELLVTQVSWITDSYSLLTEKLIVIHC